ncbi:MAG: hypothetical protein HMLKMBBP_00706 [Planctomycetes bacterium]|nr:hypothetical protein [Planctomycetota bacterium]
MTAAASPAAPARPRLRDRPELVLGALFWTVCGVTAAARGTLLHFLPYAAIVAAVLGLWSALRSRPWAGAVLDWLPFALVLVSYDMLHAVAPRSWDFTIDPWLREQDRALFGGRDLAEVLAPWTSKPATLFFAACYTLYYVGPLAVGIWWWKRDRRAFRELMVGEVGCLFLGYLGYLLLPAVGPHLHFEEAAWRAHLEGDFIGPMIRMRYEVHDGHPPRDAFPSLHTANAVTLLLMAWRHDRRVLAVVAVPMLGLVGATMYLRYHYATDVIAGVILAAAFQPFALSAVRRELPPRS